MAPGLAFSATTFRLIITSYIALPLLGLHRLSWLLNIRSTASILRRYLLWVSSDTLVDLPGALRPHTITHALAIELVDVRGTVP